MLIRVEMESFRKKYKKDYEVRDVFFDILSDFAEKDEFSSVASFDSNIIFTNRSGAFSDLVKKECTTNGEIMFWRDLRKEPFNSYVIIEKIFVANSFERRCVAVDGNYAFFRSKRGNVYKALISDSVRDRVTEGAVCIVRVLANRTFVVVGVKEEPTSEEIELEMEQVNDLLGGY